MSIHCESQYGCTVPPHEWSCITVEITDFRIFPNWYGFGKNIFQCAEITLWHWPKQKKKKKKLDPQHINTKTSWGKGKRRLRRKYHYLNLNFNSFYILQHEVLHRCCFNQCMGKRAKLTKICSIIFDYFGPCLCCFIYILSFVVFWGAIKSNHLK